MFGLPRAMEVDDAALERRYLQLSRECHPDLHRAAHTEDCVAVLHRAAELNDAFRALRDRWERARTLLELAEPGVLERNKTLAPDFLLAAMEEAEAVATVAPDEFPALRQRLLAAADDCWRSLCAAYRRGDHPAAAVTLHQSTYHRKALADLEARG